MGCSLRLVNTREHIGACHCQISYERKATHSPMQISVQVLVRCCPAHLFQLRVFDPSAWACWPFISLSTFSSSAPTTVTNSHTSNQGAPGHCGQYPCNTNLQMRQVTWAPCPILITDHLQYSLHWVRKPIKKAQSIIHAINLFIGIACSLQVLQVSVGYLNPHVEWWMSSTLHHVPLSLPPSESSLPPHIFIVFVSVFILDWYWHLLPAQAFQVRSPALRPATSSRQPIMHIWVAFLLPYTRFFLVTFLAAQTFFVLRLPWSSNSGSLRSWAWACHGMLRASFCACKTGLFVCCGWSITDPRPPDKFCEHVSLLING